MSIDIRDNYDIESFYQGFEEPENNDFNFDLKILAEIEKNEENKVAEINKPGDIFKFLGEILIKNQFEKFNRYKVEEKT